MFVLVYCLSSMQSMISAFLDVIGLLINKAKNHVNLVQ